MKKFWPCLGGILVLLSYTSVFGASGNDQWQSPAHLTVSYDPQSLASCVAGQFIVARSLLKQEYADTIEKYVSPAGVQRLRQKFEEYNKNTDKPIPVESYLSFIKGMGRQIAAEQAYLISITYLLELRYPEALEYMERAVMLDPSNEIYRRILIMERMTAEK
ncbi:MAG: hypothetical protein UY42_C0001G0038 [Parcubacteria group bacterium GW2011_GWA2_49_16]|nr:MAG: hypothetical protein UY42_C0001G0038 [Parcubacteria group bacterium GW2011_GWA2_49_16]